MPKIGKFKNHIFCQGTEKAHWCQLKVKASLEPAFSRLSRYLVPSLRLGMPLIEARPLLLAAEPPGYAFPASCWKRDFKSVLA